MYITVKEKMNFNDIIGGRKKQFPDIRNIT